MQWMRYILPAVPAMAAAYAATPRSHTAMPDGSAASKIAAADNRFGQALFAKATTEAGTDRNVIVSPSSVAFALAMVYNGAGGATREEMAKVLQLGGMDLGEVNRQNRALRETWSKPAPGVELVTANGLWADRSFQFNRQFIERVQPAYGAELATLDFHSPEAASRINGWVSHATHDRITQLVSSESLAQSVAVLTNAVYFKGEWAEPFETSRTHLARFTTESGAALQTPMMSRTVTARYAHADGVESIRLPYGKGAASMTVLLPDPGRGPGAVVAMLAEPAWAHRVAEMREASVELSLPKFKAVYATDLVPTLKAMGMGAAVGRGADFAPMGLRDGFISKVVHKAVVDVNEQGTVAAAATGVMMSRAMRVGPRMVVDRPFVFAITDDRTGAMLFLGAIRRPG